MASGMRGAPSKKLALRIGRQGPWLPALACALIVFSVFNWLGNSNQGYIHTRSLFVWWGAQWLDPASELQHAWILLALSAGLFVRNLRLRNAAPAGGAQALGFLRVAAITLCAALMLHGLGFQMQQARVSIVALLLSLWAVFGIGGGKRWSNASVFPLGLMLFAMPAGFLDAAGFWMRLWVVDASTWLLRLFGTDVLRSGTQLFDASGSYQYDVVAACSGIRSLQAILALSLVLGYLQLRSKLGRLLVPLLSLPFVYAGNVVRIVLVVLAGSAGGQASGGRMHSYSGLPIFALVMAGVLGCVFLLRKLRPDWASEPGGGEPAPVSKDGEAADETLSGTWRAGWLMAGCVLFCAVHVGVWCVRVIRADHRPASGLRLAADGVNPVDLPAFLGTSWAGRSQEPSRVEREILPPDTGYSRRLYASLDRPGEYVFFSVVLSGKDRSSIHRPELCLVGQGWSIIGRSEVQFAISHAGQNRLPATLLHVQRQLKGHQQPVPELVAYCFIGASDIVPSSLGRMWSDALSRISGEPQRWAYVLVQTGAADGEAAALARLQDVLSGALPPLLTQRQGKL